ncbi:hypothetical protein POV27_13150 [Aureisphaera galaxeae]|uniref:hypothetical protein n=1 Tax=Aureisphaera galaxeae TaxID=1538023 RepID=UPI00235046F7|nr:hypothetical protein [Aureisphaera galaxeae]MDC8005003.1 hypothetical protein [Aureisphaera galaxeae]
MKRLIFLFIIPLVLGSCSNDDSSSQQGDGVELSAQDLTITINENPEEGAFLGQLQATSNIDGEFRFLVEFTDFPEALVLNEDTGEFTVNDPTDFNFELNEQLVFNIRVSVRARIERVLLTINITNLELEGEFPGQVELTSQERVDFFGSNRYESIARDLTIGGTVPDGETPITNLLALRDLKNVSRILTIENADELPTPNGLETLESVGDLMIENNDALNDITPFSDLTVTGDFVIHRNHSIVDMIGAPTISVGETLTISENAGLLSIQGFGGNSQVEGISIIQNAFLSNITAFGSLETMSGDLLIINNPNLSNLDFMSSLREVGNHINFHKIPNAPTIALPSLTTVQGDFSVASNSAVTAISGVEGLTFVGGNFEMVNNSGLGDFCAFINLIENAGIQQNYIMQGNNYNPTQQDILDGDCSL